LNSFTLELLTREDPGSGSTLTFFQFLFLSMEGLLTNVEWDTSSGDIIQTLKTLRFKSRIVPIWAYVIMVLMHWTMSVINNASLGYQISMPLNMVFRSGSLITTAVIGRILFKKTYSERKIIGIVIVTIGIFLATMASANAPSNKPAPKTGVVANKKSEGEGGITEWSIGLAMLSAGLAITSVLGLYQTQVFEKYKNIIKQQLPVHASSPTSPSSPSSSNSSTHSSSSSSQHSGEDDSKTKSLPDPNWIDRESMFYCHFIGLPFFTFLLPDLISHVSLWNQHDKISTLSLFFSFNSKNPNLYPGSQIASLNSNNNLDLSSTKYVDSEISVMWFYLLLNSITQYVCVRGVFMLLSSGTALTTTLVLTLRKFVSLIISVFYFGNVFTSGHWLGTILVFGGTLLYSFSS